MPHIRFNWVDILFVTLVIRISYIALKNGFFPELFRSLGLLSAFIVSFNNYTLVGNFISSHTRWTDAKPDIIAFLFIFISVLFIFKMLAISARIVYFGSGDISMPNKLIALALGLGRALLLTSLIYTLFINSPFTYLSLSARDRSFSGRFVSGIAPLAYKTCINFYPGKVNNTPLIRSLQ